MTRHWNPASVFPARHRKRSCKARALLAHVHTNLGTHSVYCLLCQLYLRPGKRPPGNAAWHRPFSQMFSLPTNTTPCPYGTGKSNHIRALQYMQGVVLHSATLQPGQRPAAALPLTCQTRRYDGIPVLDADSSHAAPAQFHRPRNKLIDGEINKSPAVFHTALPGGTARQKARRKRHKPIRGL